MRRPTPLRLLATVAAALLLGGALLALRPHDGDPDTWVRVERRDLVLGAPVEGELRAVESVDIRPPQIRDLWDFRISFLAPEGSEVKPGEPVLAFDTTQLEHQLREKVAERDSAAKEVERKISDLELAQRQRELSLAEARARLRKAELKLAVPDELKARVELDKARVEEGLAELEIASLEVGLEHHAAAGRAEVAALAEKRDRAAARASELEHNIELMTVRAPRAGTVTYVRDWRGERKKVGDSVWRAEAVASIPDLGRMRAEGEVTEADAGRVEAGQRVTLRLEAHPDQEYGGVLRAIRRSVQARSRTNPQKVVRLDIDLDATDSRRMRPGMRFRGRVVAERLPDLLAVPKEAVTWTPGGAAVRRLTALGEREVFPSLGRRNGELFEVLAGLAEGDRVLVRRRAEGTAR